MSDDDGWAFLGDVGSLLQKKRPNFDPRNYGFQKLTPFD
ncbi:OST-HTH/LOTUS domain-containing protein [Carboxylicivirga sp. M1479]|nr:OST-HTH/LOTUS domain-containing protein [Carboxylicivirga sp. M1479]